MEEITVKPMLDNLELPLVQEIATYDKRMLAEHKPPGMEGSLLQNMGRRPERIVLWGIATGIDALKFVEKLEDKFKAGKPVTFIADITADSKIDNVIIEDLSWQELAGKPERYAYVLKVCEYITPPPAATEEPPKPDVPKPPDNKIDKNEGTLRVEVTVEGQTDFDYSHVLVTVEGKETDGPALSRTLTNRTDSIWTEEEFPAGDYTVKASANSQPMSGSAKTSVQAGQTAQVTISLKAVSSNIARAFTVHFWFDKAFIEPCMRQVLQKVAQYASNHSDEKLVIVGHTDLVGDSDYNQSLSERRARAVYAFVTAGLDKEAAVKEWNELRKKATGEKHDIKDSWSTREYQYMLQDLNYYNGNVDEVHGPQTDAAVRSFQQDHSLSETGQVDDTTWTALIGAYLDQGALAINESQFLRNAKDGCDGGILKWLGCGEQNPVKNTQDSWRPNRRVELLFVQADKLLCEVPAPDTFDKPAPGAVGSTWCLGKGDKNARCCFLTKDPSTKDKWLVEPAEAGTITIKGSITSDDGTPLSVEYVLAAPDGEYMNGEKPSGPNKGRPVSGRTDDKGSFAYPNKPKGIGVYVFEIKGPFVVRRAEDPPGSGKGNIICKRLDGSSDFNVVVSPAETGDPRRKLHGIIFDRFGDTRKRTKVEVLFGDGTKGITMTNDNGEFVIEMEKPQDTGKIRYNVGDQDVSDVVFFEDFFIDVKGINTDEGIRRRLHNLGYLIGEDLTSALIGFQAAQGLDTTGNADQETRRKLAAVHDGDEPIIPEFGFSEELIKPEDMIGEGPPL